MSPQTGSLAQAGRCKWHKMVSAERGGDTAGAVRVMLTPGSEAQEGNDGREMVGAICSPAELGKCVGVVIISGVDGFVGTVCLDHPEVQEVPKATNFSKTI